MKLVELLRNRRKRAKNFKPTLVAPLAVRGLNFERGAHLQKISSKRSVSTLHLFCFHSSITPQHSNMCRQIFHPEDSCLNMSNPEPLTRNYRRVMKPRLPRKITASARINLNRFWNELEEFYNRYDQRTEKPVVKLLPEYTTDTFDHKRESAENELNDGIEIDQVDENNSEEIQQQQGQTKVLNSRQRLASDDVEIEISDEDLDESTDEVFLWNLHEKSTPRPPRTLLDLIHRLSM